MILIIRRTVDYWEFDDSVNPEPVSCSGYNGLANGDNTVTFTSKNGQTKYNHVLYSEFDYVDEYGSNDHTPTSASDLMEFLKGEGFFDEGSSGGGGSTTFIGLSDVSIPGGYAANQGKMFIVSGSGLVPVTPSFAFQNNVVKNVGAFILGTGEVTAQQISDYVNNTSGFTVSEIQTPVFYRSNRTVDGVSTTFLFVFSGGKGNWGTLGTPTSPQQFIFIMSRPLTPQDVEDQPNSLIYPLGDTTGNDFWEVANGNTPAYDLSDSGDLDSEGNPRTYYFSFTDDGVLYFAQFVGAQGIYGLGELQFVESDFIITTNDTVTSIPNLQTVTEEGNITTNNIIVYDETEAEGKISYGHNEIVFTDPSGNIIRLQFPMGIVEPEVTYEFPIKDANDTFVMISDISGGSAFDRRYLYTAGSDTDTFIISDLIDATAIQMIASNVGGNVMGSDVTFNSVTGEISGYPVLTGEEHLIYYTKP